MRYAAIDIGSNAIRLLISETNSLYSKPIKLKLLRIPIRLGMDVFTTGNISDWRKKNLIKALKIYQLLMEIYDVKHFRACATSAMRCSDNGKDIIREIKKLTSIPIDIINGREEAAIIFETHIFERLDPNIAYLFIDVGGGSTELTLFREGETELNESFQLGTIRLLNGQDKKAEWSKMKHWIKSNAKHYKNLVAIGSGGNINTIFQLSRKGKNEFLSSDYIQNFCKEVSALTMEERMFKYNVKPDRADVINHACKIFNTVLNWSGIHNMMVPQVGLADGIIHQLTARYPEGSN
jgi:exopolyphosphatase / guanosine-5'-triphosphate,3'-diphosphate pyrophosphatase